jgi:hypothetical protein
LPTLCLFDDQRLMQLWTSQCVWDPGGGLVKHSFWPARRNAAMIRGFVSLTPCWGMGATARIAPRRAVQSK